MRCPNASTDRRSVLALLISAAAPPLLAAADAGADASIDQVGQKVVGFIDEGRAEPLSARFSQSMKKAVPNDKLAKLVATVREQEGRSVKLERVPGEGSERSATYAVTTTKGAYRLSLTIDAAGTILGLILTPPKRHDPPVARSPVLKQLPFSGTWSVVWGGDSLELNQHVTVPSQRRAVDALMMDATGATHTGEGRTNAEYLAYGQPVFAVADGKVETVVDGVPDNTPGEMNRLYVPGNLVVIRHTDTLFSAFAHLIPSSITVKVGRAVKAGDVIGRCGNSGNSSEAHLHFQLQDAPKFENSWGVEPVFANTRVARDGGVSIVPAYTWLKGDLVFAAPVLKERSSPASPDQAPAPPENRRRPSRPQLGFGPCFTASRSPPSSCSRRVASNRPRLRRPR